MFWFAFLGVAIFLIRRGNTRWLRWIGWGILIYLLLVLILAMGGVLLGALGG